MPEPTSKPLAIAQKSLRSTVCPTCHRRQPENEQWPDVTQPRPCEPSCTIFINLPKLMRIAHNVESPDLGAYEAAINELVCQNCKSSPTAGDYCADGQIRSCPLSRYSGDVVDVLEKAEQAWRRGK